MPGQMDGQGNPSGNATDGQLISLREEMLSGFAALRAAMGTEAAPADDGGGSLELAECINGMRVVSADMLKLTAAVAMAVEGQAHLQRTGTLVTHCPYAKGVHGSAGDARTADMELIELREATRAQQEEVRALLAELRTALSTRPAAAAIPPTTEANVPVHGRSAQSTSALALRADARVPDTTGPTDARAAQVAVVTVTSVPHIADAVSTTGAALAPAIEIRVAPAAGSTDTLTAQPTVTTGTVPRGDTGKTYATTVGTAQGRAATTGGPTDARAPQSSGVADHRAGAVSTTSAAKVPVIETQFAPPSRRRRQPRAGSSKR